MRASPTVLRSLVWGDDDRHPSSDTQEQRGVAANLRARTWLKGVATAIVGGSLMLSGIVLLVLPGPGLLLITAGLAVLASRFAWAARLLEWAKSRVHAELAQVAQSRTHAVAGTVSAGALAIAGVLELGGVDLPFVTAVTAALLIVSGTLIFATVLYASRWRSSACRTRVFTPPRR